MKTLLTLVVFAASLVAQSSRYPSSIAGDPQLVVAGNNLQSYLAIAVGANDGALIISSNPGFVVNMLVSVDLEVMQVTAVNGNSLAVNRAFDNTKASSHSAGKVVSAFITAWHHNSLKAEIQAIEAALGPNLSNVPSSTGTSLVPALFNFAVSSFQGITPGVNVVPLFPVPKGVNGTDIGHYLYISGGNGAAEAVLITGGSAVGGAPIGTIIFTAAHSHTGAYTIGSASGGIQEAIIQANAANGGIIEITATVAVHAQISIPPAGFISNYVIEGSKSGVSGIYRAADYPAGDIFSYNQTSGQAIVTIRDLTIYSGGQFGALVNNTAGAAIHIRGATSLPFLINNVLIDSAYVGVDIEGSSNVTVTGNMIVTGGPYADLYPSLAGIRLHYEGFGQRGSNNHIVGNIISSSNATGAFVMSQGILIEDSDGLQISDNAIGAIKKGISISVHAAHQIDLVKIDNNILDTFQSHCIHIFGDGGVPVLVNGISLSNNHIGTRYDTGTAFNGGGVVVDTGAYLSQFEMYNNRVQSNGLNGVSFAFPNGLIGPANIVDNEIFDNYLSNPAAGLGACIVFGATTYSNLNISGNHCYNTVSGGLQSFGLFFPNGAPSRSTIVGNDFHVVAGAHALNPISMNGAISNTIISKNGGIDDVIPAIATAATLTFPLNPNFLLSGTTDVTAVTMTAVPPGSTGTFRTVTGAVTFTAGGGIGNTLTTAQNVPVIWSWDGTSLWLK